MSNPRFPKLLTLSLGRRFSGLCLGLALLSPATAQTVFPMPFFDDFEGPMNFTITPAPAGGPTPCGACPAPCQLARGAARTGFQSEFPPAGTKALVLDSSHRGLATGNGSWSSGLTLVQLDDPLTEWQLVDEHMASAGITLDTTGYTQLTLSFDFNFVTGTQVHHQFTVEVNDGSGWSIPVGPSMNGPFMNTYLADECAICPAGCPGCGGIYNDMEWIHETIDLSPYTPGPGFEIRFRYVVRHNFDANPACGTNATAVLIDNVNVDGITMGLGVGAPFPPGQLMIGAGQLDISASPFSLTSFMQATTYDAIEVTANGTGDDMTDISEVYLYEDIDISLTHTAGDILIGMIGGGFTADNGSHVFTLPAPVMLSSGQTRNYVVAVDMAGTAVALETFRVDVTDITISAPPGAMPSGIPRQGSTLTVQLSDLTVELGPSNPSPATGVIGQVGAVAGQLEFVSVGSGTDITGVTITAVGSGNDLTGIDLIRVVTDANGNGRADVGEPVLGMGTYPANDGTVTITLSPAFSVGIVAPGQMVILYDFSATAAAPGMPQNFCFRIDNAADITCTAQSVMVLPTGTITQCVTVTDMCPRTLCGDCNTDGLVNILDALTGAQFAAGLRTLTGPQFSNCNVNGAIEPDPAAAVNIIDALRIAQNSAGLPATLVCC